MDSSSSSSQNLQSASQRGSNQQSRDPSEAAGPSSAPRTRRGSRTSNACEQCQRRKTKCSGQPAPCEACGKAGIDCRFESKINIRNRLKATYSAEDERLQYMLSGVLSALKHNNEHLVADLMSALRTNQSPQEIAAHLRRNLDALYENGHLPRKDLDDDDLINLASRLDQQNLLSGLSINTDGLSGGQVAVLESPQSSQEGWQSYTQSPDDLVSSMAGVAGRQGTNVNLNISPPTVPSHTIDHTDVAQPNLYWPAEVQTPNIFTPNYQDHTFSVNAAQMSWYALQRQNEYAHANQNNQYQPNYQQGSQEYFGMQTEPQAQLMDGVLPYSGTGSMSQSFLMQSQDFTNQQSQVSNHTMHQSMRPNQFQQGPAAYGSLAGQRQLPTLPSSSSNRPPQRLDLEQEEDLCRQQ